MGIKTITETKTTFVITGRISCAEEMNCYGYGCEHKSVQKLIGKEVTLKFSEEPKVGVEIYCNFGGTVRATWEIETLTKEYISLWAEGYNPNRWTKEVDIDL